MEEIWKDIKNYNGYQASNLGRIRTYNKITFTNKHGERHWKNRILKPKGQTYKTGYRVTLWKDGKPKDMLVARLVAFTFYNEDINNHKLTVDHIDGNRFNNNINNLELVSLEENIKRGFSKGLYHNLKKVKIQYKDCARSFICNSLSEGSRKLGMSVGYLSNCIKKGKYENKYAIWELV